MRLLSGVLLLSFFVLTGRAQDQYILASPNDDFRVVVAVQNTATNNSVLRYSLWFKKRQIVSPSKASLRLNRPQRLFEKMIIFRVDSLEFDSTWRSNLSERSVIHDHYKQFTFWIRNNTDSTRYFKFVCRAYNEGVALRFEFPEQRSIQILDIEEEEFEFRIPLKSLTFFSGTAQSKYIPRPLNTWPVASERPLTAMLPDSTWVCITEANTVNYARMQLAYVKETQRMVSKLSSNVTETPPFKTPWRVIMAAETPGELAENNFILLNLNPPADPKSDWSWVKPGKLIRDNLLTTENAKACIDLAEKLGLRYVLFDAGWYGNEYEVSSSGLDSLLMNNEMIKLNIREAIEYGRARNVGIWLYVNHRALERRLESLFQLYSEWGVAGVKFGFVHTGSHRWTVWLHEAVEKAAKYKLMVNIHDEYRPTGFSRTFPNLLTQEGLLGNEAMPDATHNTILPFTRYIAGAGDYTPAYFSRENIKPDGWNKLIKNTSGHQLALPIIFFSPIQSLFWYDFPNEYQGEPELELWKQMPVVWDETKVLSGTPGEFIVTARRSGDDWYVGGITNTEKRTLTIPFDFLPPNKSYQATIYYDDPTNSVSRTAVSIKEAVVNAGVVLSEKLLASGGISLHLRPVEN